MMARLVLTLICVFFAAGCSAEETLATGEPRRIISLDFCADQYLLAFADREQIVALSPDVDKSFSYLRDDARGIRQIQPRAEDVLIENPDAIIRTYGGGPNVAALMNRVGVEVIQIGYADDLEAIRRNVIAVAAALGQRSRGEAVAAEMDRRIAAIDAAERGEILYMTSKGAVAGRETLIDELIAHAGRRNFVDSVGWRMAPLERLAYESPEVIAAGFFDGPDARTDHWSPARHPVARRALRDSNVIDIPGDWTACGAWFVVDAIEALAAQ